MLKDLSISSNLNSVILRYFNAAGASEDTLIGENHDPETHLIPLALKAAIFKKQDLKILEMIMIQKMEHVWIIYILLI